MISSGGMKSLLWMYLLVWSVSIGGAQGDTHIFTYQEYLSNILQYHPLSQKADLKLLWAQAEMLDARGALDPNFASDWNQKRFDDKLYYRHYQANVRVPTPLGIDIGGGYENSNGDFLDPEATTDAFGLWHLGIEVNILQGLIINERRTALDQARVYQELAQNERQIALNDLIYDASIAYLLWQQYEYYDEVLTENISISDTYLENTKLSFLSGEKTAMDTLEALILYQDAISIKQKNESGRIKARQNVENFLWYQDAPAALYDHIRPEDYSNPIMIVSAEWDTSQMTSHPIIMASLNKLSYLELEQRLKREKLKPKLKIKYNPLIATSANSLTPNFSTNDFKLGFDFAMPLFFRSERAAIQHGKIKIEETQLDIDNKTNELQNKIDNSWQQQLLLQEQVDILTDNVENYRRLLEGENQKFLFGESSVFLLNKRQEKYINGQLKLIETYIKRQMELLNFQYYTNQMFAQ